MGDLRAWVGNSYLSTNPLEMYECDAPVSKRTSVVNDLTKNLPITASGWVSTYVVHLSPAERVRLLPRASIAISILSFRTFIGIMSGLGTLKTGDLTWISLGWG